MQSNLQGEQPTGKLGLCGEGSESDRDVWSATTTSGISSGEETARSGLSMYRMGERAEMGRDRKDLSRILGEKRRKIERCVIKIVTGKH